MTTKLPGSIGKLFDSMFKPCKRNSNIINIKIRKHTQDAAPATQRPVVVTKPSNGASSMMREVINLPTPSPAERALAELIGIMRADIIELNIRCDSLERQLIKLRESYELERGD